MGLIKAQEEARNYFSAIIGARIATRRKELKLSQQALADAYGVSRSLISQIETGRGQINAGDLPRLADILNVPVSYFYASIKQAREIEIELTEEEEMLLSYYRGIASTLVRSVVMSNAQSCFQADNVWIVKT